MNLSLILALMAAAGLGYEVALTRYFAVAHYSEYGYWVISMAMAGFAVSGVLLSLFKSSFERHQKALFAWLPVTALICAGLGFYGVALNPFNALELQHPELWDTQLLNIGKFYLAIFPFFFCIGLYVSLCFVCFGAQVAKLYAWDLSGAGLGALAILLAMFFIPPFYLPTVILPLLALAGFLSGKRAASLIVLALFELLFITKNPARPCEYKPLAYALNTEGAKVLAHWQSPRGDYHIVEDFTEHLDIDLSNNAGLMKVAGPPATLGLYQDGSRVAALPKTGYGKTDYFKAALESFPYTLEPKSVLLIGTRGGFRYQEAGSRKIVALEPDPELFRQIKGLPLLRRQPLEFLANNDDKFDLIDVTLDDKFAFTLEALKAYQSALNEDGVVSLGLSIQEFAPYAVKLLKSLRGAHILVYRSAWNMRVLILKTAPTAKTLKSLEDFCSKRSFDIVCGADSKEIYNDLPALGWHEAQSTVAKDALAEEAARIMAGQPLESEADFDLRPATFDRPFFYSALRLTHLKDIFRNLNLIPREELGSLVNLAVLAQALCLSLLVLLLPLLAPKRLGSGSFTRLAIYFASLGLGYLFFEVTLIEKITPYLQDRAFAFSLVLCSMLVFSGLGSAYAGRFGLGKAMTIVICWLVMAWLGLDKLLFAMWGWPFFLQALVCVALIAPLAFALGMPFPLGLSSISKGGSALPWAWSLNGAFSVLAGPVAFLAARQLGYEAVAGLAFLVYFLAWLTYPKNGKF